MAVPSPASYSEHMTKARARSEAKDRRQAYVAALTPAERCVAAVMLAERVEAQLSDARIVAIYLPIGAEIDTLPLIERLERRGLAIALPHVTSRRAAMRFLAWTPGDPLPAGPMGLRQPAADAPELVPDLILTPLLAFDVRLHRLGYGAGFYDRAFEAIPQARRVGLAWSVQQVATIADDSWDVPLHAVATEKEWIEA
jgi:5-formyltetrahydrofolate cyclo-ligase